MKIIILIAVLVASIQTLPTNQSLSLKLVKTRNSGFYSIPTDELKALKPYLNYQTSQVLKLTKSKNTNKEVKTKISLSPVPKFLYDLIAPIKVSYAKAASTLFPFKYTVINPVKSNSGIARVSIEPPFVASTDENHVICIECKETYGESCAVCSFITGTKCCDDGKDDEKEHEYD